MTISLKWRIASAVFLVVLGSARCSRGAWLSTAKWDTFTLDLVAHFISLALRVMKAPNIGTAHKRVSLHARGAVADA